MTSLHYLYGELKSFKFSYTPYYWLTVTSLAVLLFLGGIFISSFWFTDRWESLFKENIEFLAECRDQISKDQIGKIEAQLKSIEGVRELRFVTEDEALQIMQKELGKIAFPDSMENPFHASFRFKLDVEKVDTSFVKELEKQVIAIDGISGLFYPEDLYSSLRDRIRNISMFSAAVGGLLILLILVMIHHQIRMYIMQHRYHIRTMSLVGATRAYIRKPFISEVLKMSSFSILVAGIAYLLALLWFGKMVGHSLFAHNMDMVTVGLIFIVALGTLMSFSAAWAAIQRYLESTDAKDFI